MDKTDRKILYAIAENARESRNVLAKRVGISRETFDYRVKKLEEEKIINGYQARINLSNFTYSSYLLLIQASGGLKEIEKQIALKMKNDVMTHYIGRIGGNYDFLISFSIKEQSELLKYISKINLIFGKHKTKMTILTMIEESKDSFQNIFAEKDELNNIVSRQKILKNIEIDKIDRQILISLGSDGRMYSPKIASKIDLTEVATRKRIKNLVDKKIILNFRAMIDFTKVGLQTTNIFFKINTASEIAEKKLKNVLQTDNKIYYACRLVGEYDYIIGMVSKDNKELNEYISKLREEFTDTITDINICPTFELLHHNYVGEEFFN